MRAIWPAQTLPKLPEGTAKLTFGRVAALGDAPEALAELAKAKADGLGPAGTAQVLGYTLAAHSLAEPGWPDPAALELLPTNDPDAVAALLTPVLRPALLRYELAGAKRWLALLPGASGWASAAWRRAAFRAREWQAVA